jgi:hypothetical protein
MRYLKLFENHQTEAEVAEICQRYGIENWTLNSDGLVDVDGNVDLSECMLTKLPLKFGHVTGYFYCADNLLTTLEGAPHTVVNFFNCQSNQLTSLEGAPHTVGSGFQCENNNLTSLEFAPKSVGSNFWCRFNNIRSFEGLVNIGGDFYCADNPLEKIWNIINPIDNKWDNDKMDFFNDLDIIRGEEIVLDRLNFFLSEIGLTERNLFTFTSVETVKGYKIID